MTSDRVENLRGELNRYEKIEGMRRTEGWAFLQRHIALIIRALQLKLMSCNVNDLASIQERIRAFSSVLEYVNDDLKMADAIKAELDVLMEEEKFAEKYALNK